MFELAGREEMQICCSCGKEKMITGLGESGVWIVVNCLLCEEEHLTIIPFSDYLRQEVRPIYCTSTGAEIGFYGQEDEVIAEAGKGRVSLESLAAAAQREKFLQVPEIVYGILRKLEDLADRKRLACECGNKTLQVKVGETAIRLYCPKCGQYTTIQAVSDDDLRRIQEIESICIGEPREERKLSKRRKVNKGQTKRS